MGERMTALKARFNAWLLAAGQVRVVLAITALSVVLSVLMTWVANAIFMPEVPIEEWLYVSLIVPAIISPPVSWIVLSLLYQLAEAKAALVAMSETDPLTGVGNRRHFFASAERAFVDATKFGEPFCVVLLDIDHFKRLNDTHGHAVGDTALVAVATACRQTLRTEDVFCRWGGEEFIVLSPATALEGGCTLAERLRSRVAETPIKGAPEGVTLSAGVAQLMGVSQTLDDVIADADRWLYLAKDSGRNRVEPREAVRAAIAPFHEARQQLNAHPSTGG